MDLQTLNTISGLIMTGIILLGAIIGGIFMVKSGLGKKESDAQNSALTAMNTELTVLRGRVADTEKENARLNNIVNTIISALEQEGMIVTIRGTMVYIKNSKGNTVNINVEEKDS